MDENARKRKREEEGQTPSDDNELGTEKPLEGLKRGVHKSKKQKKTGESENGEEPVNQNKTSQDRDDERLKQKEAQKAAKQEKKKQKAAERSEMKKQKQTSAKKPTKTTPSTEASKVTTSEKHDKTEPNDDASDSEEIAEEMVPIEGFSHGKDEDKDETTGPTSPADDANPFDTLPSRTSSISSIVPPTENITKTAKDANDSKEKPLKPTPEELKQRLQKRLDELRAARHADGLNGKPARNRQELIEARRQREEKRRAHKKELRQKAKEEEQRLRDEAIAKRFSPRGSLLTTPQSPTESITSIPTNFSFGRVVFADGQTTDPNLTGLRDPKKQRGPQDPATALKAAEAKKARIAALDDEKKADIEEKDMWLNAKKRAHGDKVKDDVSLLKKALNRKESIKKKSAKQWNERLEGIAKSKDARQAKREENIRKRKEEKGGKGKKGKTKARPGFEGSFKTKAGGKKK